MTFFNMNGRQKNRPVHRASPVGNFGRLAFVQLDVQIMIDFKIYLSSFLLIPNKNPGSFLKCKPSLRGSVIFTEESHFEKSIKFIHANVLLLLLRKYPEYEFINKTSEYFVSFCFSTDTASGMYYLPELLSNKFRTTRS